MNPFFNVFYPENDLSCLTFRTRFAKGRGSFDVACGFSECRLAQFVTNGDGGDLRLMPYMDDERCTATLEANEIRIIDGDFEEFLLIYGCYFREGKKIEGAYLLTRPGSNFSIKFYKKLLQPVLMVASMRQMIIPELDFNSACNCTDHCSYYELKGGCNRNVQQSVSGRVTDHLALDLLIGVTMGLIVAVAAILCWYWIQRNPFSKED